jgi:Protein of unknown function (DUF3168)
LNPSVLIPETDVLVRDYLLSSPAIAEIVGERIFTKPPGALGRPWIRVSVYDEPPTGKSTADYHIAARVDLHCYAGTEGGADEASRLGRLVRAWMSAMDNDGQKSAVVSGAKVEGGRPLLDDSLDPPIDRYLVHVVVWAHGVEEGS